jgi:hypothetical protein
MFKEVTTTIREFRVVRFKLLFVFLGTTSHLGFFLIFFFCTKVPKGVVVPPVFFRLHHETKSKGKKQLTIISKIAHTNVW